MDGRERGLYWAAVLAILAALIVCHWWMGTAIFSLLAWTYNIAHFIKAEIFFSGVRERKAAFYSPVAAFAWFTLCLFLPALLSRPHVVFAGTAVVAAVLLAAGGWKLLASGEVLLPMLTCFLLGETLVWASYGPSDAFRVGVYIFHIAAASFYHYLTAYFYAESSPLRQRDHLVSGTAILAINIVVLGLGYAVAWLPALHWLSPLLGVSWFTVWVALHLAASDLMPFWKRRFAG